jgi:hypothetical protein
LPFLSVNVKSIPELARLSCLFPRAEVALVPAWFAVAWLPLGRARSGICLFSEHSQVSRCHGSWTFWRSIDARRDNETRLTNLQPAKADHNQNCSTNMYSPYRLNATYENANFAQMQANPIHQQKSQLIMQDFINCKMQGQIREFAFGKTYIKCVFVPKGQAKPGE